MVAISMNVDGRIWRADNDNSLTDLLDVVFATPREPGWVISMIAFPSQGPPPGPHTPHNRLRVAIDPTCRWAALYFLQLHPQQHLWQTWTSLSRNMTLDDVPRLSFGRRGLVCPRTATITADSGRKAIAEYSHTACRPEAILWQLPTTFRRQVRQ
jgi:hypothetical protein